MIFNSEIRNQVCYNQPLYINPLTSKKPCLEDEFEQEWNVDVDINYDCNFKDYLDPTEGCPQNIKPHLDLAAEDEGIFLSAGTERSFFDLCLSEEKKCGGLVIRDINPRVKAYVDFNILLLRITNSMGEYDELSKDLEKYNDSCLDLYYENGLPEHLKEALNKRIKIIEEKINQTELPEKLKNYHVKNVENFALVYFKSSKHWKYEKNESDPYKEVHYHKIEKYYYKLRKYAISGNIISTIGKINDLNFLQKKKISIIDTSNISDYCPLDFRGEKEFNPRIIWANQNTSKAAYNSYIHTILKKEASVKLDESINLFIKAYPSHCNRAQDILKDSSLSNDIFDKENFAVRSLRILEKIQYYIQNNILNVNEIAVDMTPFFIGKLNRLNLDQIRLLVESKEIKKFIPHLINANHGLEPSVYISFCQVEGWKEEFTKKFSNPDEKLPRFLEQLREENLLEGFAQEFGKESLEALLEMLNLSSEIEELNNLDLDIIRLLVESKEIKNSIPHLINAKYCLEPSVYISFCQVEGWKEEFTKKFSNPLENLLERLREENLLEGFAQEFGKESPEALLEKLKLLSAIGKI